MPTPFLSTLNPIVANSLTHNIYSLLECSAYSMPTNDIRTWVRDNLRVPMTLEQTNTLLDELGCFKDAFFSQEGHNFFWIHPSRVRDIIYQMAFANGQWQTLSLQGNINQSLECSCCRRRYSNNHRGIIFRMTPALNRDMGERSDRICLRCAIERQYPQCSSPGCQRYDSPARYRPVEQQCSYCYRRFLEDNMYLNYRMIKQRPTPKTKPNVLYSGCEIECYVDPKTQMNFSEKYVFSIKRDGSLTATDKGHPIELVTQPLLDLRTRGMTTICKELAKHSAKVDNTCGGHVHIEAMTLNLNRLQNMEAVRHLFRIYESVFYAVTAPGRVESNYCYPVAWNNNPLDSRYHSMNFCSYEKYGTLEFRCFGGSVEASKWLDRIDLCEGFVLFARDTLKLPLSTQFNNTSDKIRSDWAFNYDKIQKLSEIDSGFKSWQSLSDQYGSVIARTPNVRNRALTESITANGEALITLAGTRFGLTNATIDRLINYHKILWKKK